MKPQPTMIPIFSWMRGIPAAIRTLFGSTTAPRSRGAVLIKIGLALYDFYGARHRVMPTHAMAGKARSLADMPSLTPAIVATGTYFDASVTHPERLVYELIEDGLADSPSSIAVNHARVAPGPDGTLTVSSLLGRGSLALRPTVVINAAGPWIDAANAVMGEATRFIGGTKGSHLLLKHDALLKELDGRMIYFEADDGRICLVFEYLGLAMVGSTDIKSADPDGVRCEPEETDYLLESLRRLLPRLAFDRSQIVYTYSGVRPLPASDAKNPGLISRDHSTPTLEPTPTRPYPVISLVGGKWTTFRGFAEEVADGVLARLGRQRRVSTRDLAIGGGRGYPPEPGARRDVIAAIARRSGLAEAQAEGLFDRYGTRAFRVAVHVAAAGGTAPLAHAPDMTAGEVDFLIREEHVGRLVDLVLRRTTLAVTGRLDRALLDELAGHAAGTLGWSDARRAAEIDTVVAEMETRHGVVVGPVAPIRLAADGGQPSRSATTARMMPAETAPGSGWPRLRSPSRAARPSVATIPAVRSAPAVAAAAASASDPPARSASAAGIQASSMVFCRRSPCRDGRSLRPWRSPALRPRTAASRCAAPPPCRHA